MGQVSPSATSALRWICGTLLAVVGIACGPKMTNDPIPKENQNVTTLSNQPALDADLEAELAQIRRAPAAAVGMGEKAYSPYELVEGEDLVRATEPEVVPRLAAEALDQRNVRVFRFVMLQILGLRPEAAVDAALMNGLADPLLRPLAAYFLGRPGYKGYPARDRNTVTPILRALAAYLQDAGVYEDPWYHNTRATADLVLAAFVRIAGPDAFTFAKPEERDFIGYTLRFPDGERAGLLEQALRWPLGVK